MPSLLASSCLTKEYQSKKEESTEQDYSNFYGNEVLLALNCLFFPLPERKENAVLDRGANITEFISRKFN